MQYDNINMKSENKTHSSYLLLLAITLIFNISCVEEESELEASLGSDDTELVQDTPSNGSGDEETREEVESEVPAEEVVNSNFNLLIDCSAEQDKKKTCKLDNKKKIINFEIITKSSECSDHKKNLNIRRFDRKITVRNGCNVSVNILTGDLTKSELNMTGNAFSQTGLSFYDFGDITLTKKYKKGSEVLINNDSGIASYSNNGVGVAGGDIVADQINYDPSNHTFQAIGVELPENSSRVEVEVSRLFQKEGERAIVLILDEENKIMGKKTIQWKKKESNEHVKKVKVNTYNASKMIIAPLQYKDQKERMNDSSDFLVKSINFINYQSDL